MDICNGNKDSFFWNTKFDLDVFYKHHSSNSTYVKGFLHLTGKSQEDELGIPFEFIIYWKEYRLPMDLALQKLIEKSSKRYNLRLSKKEY
jgi:hypothetical protein